MRDCLVWGRAVAASRLKAARWKSVFSPSMTTQSGPGPGPLSNRSASPPTENIMKSSCIAPELPLTRTSFSY